MSLYPTKPARLDFGGSGVDVPSIDPLRKGSTFIRKLEISGLDLSTLELRMSVKEGYGKPAIIFFSTQETDPNEPRIIVTNNFIEFEIPAALTETYDAGSANCIPRKKKYLYDLEGIDLNGVVFALLEGQFWIVDEITTEEF